MSIDATGCKVSDWDPISQPRRMWGVFNVEQPYECTALAMFHTEVEAVAWISWCREQNKADGDDPSYREVDYYHALPMREVQGELWNSYDPPPEEKSS